MKLRSKNHMEAYLLDKYPPFSGVSAIKSGVKLPGTAGNYISTPDSVLNSITGDIDIRVCLKMDSIVSDSSFIAKYSTASNFGWYFASTSSSALRFRWSPDGTTLILKDSTANTSLVSGVASWIRVTLDVDNGAGGNDLKFYGSQDGITWTKIGATITTTGVTNLFDSTAPVEIGSRTAGTALNLAGTVYYAEVRNGIDGPVVAKFDSSQVQATGAMLPASINGWTWNGTALYKRDDYVRLPGTAGNYLSFPDTTANRVTGDIDLRIKVSLDDWTPAAIQTLAAKYGAAGQRSFLLRIETSGRVGFYWTEDGTTIKSASPAPAAGVSDGIVKWVRATLDVDNGATQNEVKIYTSDDGVTWTQLGATLTTAGVTSIFDSTSVVALGTQSNGTTEPLAGNVYYAEVRNGINGPVVASFNAADFADVQTPWTINGAGWSWEGSSFTGKPVTALSLPTSATNYTTTPDTAGNSVAGDLDLRIRCALDDWTTVESYLFSKYLISGNQKVWGFGIFTLNRIIFYQSLDGAAAASASSTTSAIPLVDGQPMWLRVTRVSATGAIAFYYSTNGTSWTPCGTASLASGNLFDSTAPITVGGLSDGYGGVAGKYYYAEVRNGIDGPIVAKFDATNIARTGVRTPTTTVQPGGTPNLLTPNQASIETDATGWVVSVNATIVRSTAQFLDGAASLEITASAIGASGISSTPSGVNGIKVIEDKLYTAICSMRAASIGRATKIVIKWYDAAGASLGFSGNGASTDVTTGWTVATISGVAPNGAVTAELQITVNDVLQALGEVHYVDRVSLVEAAELWSIQGSAWDLVQVA